MRRCFSAVLIAVLVAVVITGCGGGGGGGNGGNGGNGGGGNNGGTTDTILTGRVVSSQGGVGVAGVLVKFGFPQVQAISDANGNFSLNLGTNTTVLSKFPAPPYNFQVETTSAGDSFPNFLPVQYGGLPYEQIPELGGASLPVPQTVLGAPASGDFSLGIITITFYDPDNPPPPPF